MNTTLLLGLALAVGAPLKEPPKKEEHTVTGEWMAESETFAGRISPMKAGELKMTFTKDGVVHVEHDGHKEYPGRYTIDFKKKPVEMDLVTPPKLKEQPGLCICKI